ncbi:MAG: cytochrome b/b6 domain-containing protein, partial [Gammaproteobacteria bacterium]|nr:cytochrome b/b6 domain-containing protein [Gammaproteobacteria bacterium]
MTQPDNNSRMLDQADSFGWVSILLHWLTTVLIITLWFIGRSITEQGSLEAVDARRSLHITIALSSWLLLLFRIVWRLRMHHPRAAGQSLLIHRFARSVHYIMLAVLSLMMISGPVMSWVDDKAITDAAYIVHSNSANVLFGLVLLHIGGTLKHII